jgi:transposase
MAMGRRKKARQRSLWVETATLENGLGHPFYKKLNAVLERHGFDEFAEAVCHAHYADVMGRPSLAPGVYFRMLFIGYFEGIDSERGIAWRLAGGTARPGNSRCGSEV